MTNDSNNENDDGRDALGRFAKGNHPVTGFHTNPERRNTFPTRGRSFELTARKYLNMTDEQLAGELAKAERGELTQVQQLALRLLANAKDAGNPAQQLKALRELLDRTEGRPRQAVEVGKETPEPPVINLTFA